MKKTTILFLMMVPLLLAEAQKPVAVILAFKGNVKIQRSGKLYQSKKSTKLLASDQLKLAAGSAVKVKYMDGRVKLYKFQPGKQLISIATELKSSSSAKKGSLDSIFASKALGKLKKKNGSAAYAPTTVAGVRGDDVEAQKEEVKEEDLAW